MLEKYEWAGVLIVRVTAHERIQTNAMIHRTEHLAFITWLPFFYFTLMFDFNNLKINHGFLTAFSDGHHLTPLGLSVIHYVMNNYCIKSNTCPSIDSYYYFNSKPLSIIPFGPPSVKMASPNII